MRMGALSEHVVLGLRERVIGLWELGGRPVYDTAG